MKKDLEYVKEDIETVEMVIGEMKKIKKETGKVACGQTSS